MRRAVVLFCLACSAALSVHAAEDCGDLKNGHGPFDYRTEKGQLGVVEFNHFDPGVENLVRGKNAPLGADIDYTLRAYPNHPRALMAMDKLGAKLGTERVPHATYSVPCYFERAVRFSPNDGTVRMLYALYLAKRARPADAITQLQVAEKLIGQNANLHYNMGLAYLDLKDYDQALNHAHIAYQLGFPLPGLRTRLQKAGKWREPQVTAPQKVESPAPETAKVESSAAASEPAVKP
jgi:hypothetical protein